MLGKAFSVVLIILGVYILASSLLSLGSQPSCSYHIGCYEADHSLNQTQRIQQYLSNLTSTFAPSSVDNVRTIHSKTQRHRVSTEGARTIASEFKKYIIALENIKKLNDYELSYNQVLRDAQNDFANCKQQFEAEGWDCNGSYQRYLDWDDHFISVKGNLSDLISLKFKEQSEIEKLLEPPGYEGGDNETHQKLMAKLNQDYERTTNSIKQLNETLLSLEMREFRQDHELIQTKRQLEECRKNINHIAVCKKISEEIKKIDYGLAPSEIQKRIDFKYGIIDRYQNALAKSIKLGEDTTAIRKMLAENQKEYDILNEMKREAESRSHCSDEIIFKCSEEQVEQLEKNITNLTISINNTKIHLIQVRESIIITQQELKNIEEQREKAIQDYQNSIGSLDKIKQMEATNLEKLQEHKNKIKYLNKQIEKMRREFSDAENGRQNSIRQLDIILKRVSPLTNCLSKKDYLQQLKDKRPEKREEDVKLRRRAAQKLLRAIRQTYK